ncbi:MAG TPA: hypothetical protein PLY86_07010 [bacterium]|nr:hypothetical protein [bacterium]
MNRRDFILCACFSVCVVAGVLFAGPVAFMPLPSWLYLPLFLLYAVSLDARRQARPDFPGIALFPALFVSFFTLFCLLNQLPVELWAFTIPNSFPLAVKAGWAVLVGLLLHPDIERRFFDALRYTVHFLEIRGYFGKKAWVTVVGALLFLWPFHSLNVSPDGYDWLLHSAYPDRWVNYLREPLSVLSYRGVALLGAWLVKSSPMVSIAVLDYLCGVVAVSFLCFSINRLQEEKEERLLWLFAILSSCGFTQIFLGNIEVYALLTASFTLFLWTALRYRINGKSPVWVGLAFALMFLTHLSAAWWIPVFCSLPFLRSRKADGQIFLSRDFLVLGLSSFLPVSVFTVWLMYYGFGGDPGAMWDHFWGVQVMRVGTDAAMFRTASEIFSWSMANVLFNMYFYLSPVACGLVLFLLWNHRLPHWNRRTAFLALLFIPYFIYGIAWRPDKKFPSDWDIFSGMTAPTLLFLLYWLECCVADRENRLAILRPLIVFSGSLAILQALYNHFLRITEWPFPG